LAEVATSAARPRSPLRRSQLCRLNVLLDTDIGSNEPGRRAEPQRELLAFVLSPSGDHDARAFADEKFSDTRANAARRAGDHGDLAIKNRHGRRHPWLVRYTHAAATELDIRHGRRTGNPDRRMLSLADDVRSLYGPAAARDAGTVVSK
jgi:hypothetical protein